MDENFVIMKGEFHIMFNLFCFLIMSTDFMKSYDIIFKWSKKGESDMMMIQNQHRVKIKMIKNSSVHFKKINNAALTIVAAAKLSVKTKILKASKRRQTNVYAEKARIIKKNQKQNISMIHKSLVFDNYIFESVQRRNSTMKSYLSDVNAVIQNDWNSVLMTNFEKTSAKINKNQFFGRLISFKKRNNLITVDYNYANVFFDKVVFFLETKISIDFDPKVENTNIVKSNAFFGKTISVFNVENSINFFIIVSANADETKNSNVNDH